MPEQHTNFVNNGLKLKKILRSATAKMAAKTR